MKNRAVLLGVLIGGVGVGSVAVLAGDLNPPSGPITSTMHSLEDVYQATRAGGGCEPCLWEHKVIPLMNNQYQVVMTGSGFLHSVFLNHRDVVEFWDTTNIDDRTQANYLGSILNTAENAMSKGFDIDLPYTKALVVISNSQQNRPIVFKYRPN